MKLKIKLHSSLLIGGYSTPIGFADSATSRGDDGAPIIPASAIKGAIRFEFERLFCEKTHSLPDFCVENSKCPACQIFGCPGSEGKIKITDGLLSNQELKEIFVNQVKSAGEIKQIPTLKGYVDKFGVKINRTLKMAEDKCLYSNEVIPGFSEAEFESFIDTSLLTEEEINNIQTALANVKSIGALKSTGMGSIIITADTLSTETGLKNFAIGQTKNFKDYFVKVTAHEDIHIGKIKNSNYFLSTLNYIPGSSFRGAIATAILKKYKYDKNKIAEFDKIFTAQNSNENLFSNLIPVKNHTFNNLCPSITLSECKKNPEKHGLYDMLIPRFVAQKLNEIGLNFISYREMCPVPKCAGTLKPVNSILDYDGHKVSVEKKVYSKCGLNRVLNCAEDEMLYSLEVIKRGTLFAGTIKNLSDEAFNLLCELQNAPIHVGGNKSKGLGNIKVELAELSKISDIRKKITDFNNCIDKCFNDVKNEFPEFNEKINSLTSNLTNNHNFYISITLTSEFVVPDEISSLPAENWFNLENEFECQSQNIATTILSSYDLAENKKRKMTAALSAGSVFIFRSKNNVSLNDEIIAKLKKLEEYGTGNLKNTGCGQVSICDSVHLKGVL